MWFNSNEYVTNGYSGFEKFFPIFKRGIFLDTAPLFILICGHYDKNNGTCLIENFNAKITKDDGGGEYKDYDYNFLIAFLNSLNNKKIPLLITPHIFTEFVRKLWEIVENPKQFRDIITKSFKSKSQIKDGLTEFFCNCFLDENDFLDKKLEVGDISILICAKNEKERQGATSVLTDDTTFALISHNKHDLITIFYPEIRMATHQLGSNNIPKHFLNE